MLLLNIDVIFQGAKLVEKSHKTILYPIFYPFLGMRLWRLCEMASGGNHVG